MQNSAIESGLRSIIEPDTVFEIRALKVARNGAGYAGTWSGYFDDFAAAAAAVESIDGRAVGLYATLNPVNPALIARAKNRIRELRSGEPTTSDADVMRRTRWLLDIDPIRPAGISSTDAEHALAVDRADAIRLELAAVGAPGPVVIDSGNGAQLVYAIDLPSDDGGLLKRALAGVAFRFDDDAVKVDLAVFNPARISKIPGTMTRKGDDTPERPHRRSCVIDEPDELRPVSTETLNVIATWLPEPDKAQRPAAHHGGATLDLLEWLSRYGIEARKPRDWHGGVIVKIPCPWSPEHDQDGWAAQAGSGSLSAGCWHATCPFKTWKDLRERYEPRRLKAVPREAPADEPEWLASELTDDQHAALSMIGSAVRAPRRVEGFTWQRLDVREAIAAQPKPIEWLVEGLCAKGNAVVLTAETGLGKTYLSLQMAIDAAAGRPVCGLYEVPRPLKILWVDEEMGLDMLSDRINRQVLGAQLETHEIDLLQDNLDVRYQQGLSLGDRDQLAIYDETLREGRYDLVFVDSMVALTTGKENDADDNRDFYKRCIAPYKGSLGTAFWTLAHPPKPTKDSPPDTKHRPRGSGDKINAVDRSFYLEKESETESPGVYTLRVSIFRDKKRQLGSIDGHVIAIDGPEARPVRVYSEGPGEGQKNQDYAKVNACVQDMLVKLRNAPKQRYYQPAMNDELIALGYDKRNHIAPARAKLQGERLIKVTPAIASEGRGKWLQMAKDRD